MSGTAPLSKAFENISISNMALPSNIQALSRLITIGTDRIDSYYRGNNLPPLSLEVGAPAQPNIPHTAGLQEARRIVIEATEKLRNLLLGPQELLKVEYPKNISIHAIIRFKIHKAFHPNERSSFEEIAAKIGMSISRVRRILRHGMTYNLFEEPEIGVVIHTALTEQLYNDEGMESCVATIVEEMLPAASATVNALEQWPDSEEPNETGFSHANGGDTGMFDTFQNEPLRGQRFAKFMSFLGGSKAPDVEILLENYDWHCPMFGRIVDVGGSHGDVSIGLARRFPRLQCVVQDLPQTIEEGIKKLPDELSGRVNYMAHNFFKAQPVIADVYYFRWIFHNWADKYCILILHNLIPSLHPGARILIHDLCVPKPGTAANVTEERRARTMDMAMLMQLNAQERDEDEWAELFQKADTNFRFDGIEKPPGSKLSFIMATWIGPRKVSNTSPFPDPIVDKFLSIPLESPNSEASDSAASGDHAAMSLDPREEGEAPSDEDENEKDQEEEDEEGGKVDEGRVEIERVSPMLVEPAEEVQAITGGDAYTSRESKEERGEYFDMNTPM